MTDETVEEVARRKRAERLARQDGETPEPAAPVEAEPEPAEPVELSELDKRSEESRAGDKPAHIREGGKGGFGN